MNKSVQTRRRNRNGILLVYLTINEQTKLFKESTRVVILTDIAKEKGPLALVNAEDTTRIQE